MASEMDLHLESEDLRAASSQNENIVMELSLSTKVQFVSPSWEDIVGIPIRKMLKHSISRFIVGDAEDKNVFANATEALQRENSSQRVQFTVRTASNPPLRTVVADPSDAYSSSLPNNASPRMSFVRSHRHKMSLTGTETPLYDTDADNDADNDDNNDSQNDRDSIGSAMSLQEDLVDDDDDSSTLLGLEGQGILINDRSGKPTHVSYRPFFYFNSWVILTVDNVGDPPLYCSPASGPD